MDMMLSIFGALVLWSAIPFFIILFIILLYIILVSLDRIFKAYDRFKKRVKGFFNGKKEQANK